MDPTLQGLLNSYAAESFKDHSSRMARQADSAGIDHRGMTGWVMQQLAGAGVGDLNTISHVPSSQPYVVPNFVNPQGGPPATTPKP